MSGSLILPPIHRNDSFNQNHPSHSTSSSVASNLSILALNQRTAIQPTAIQPNTQSIDPLAAFHELIASLPPIPAAQASSTPSSLLIAYIHSILDETKRDLDLINWLHPTIIDDPNLNEEASPELIIALKEHFHLEQTNQPINQTTSIATTNDDGLTNRSINHSSQSTQRSFNQTITLNQSTNQSQAELEHCLIDSTLSLLRLLRAHPNIATKLETLSYSQRINELFHTFRQSFDEMLGLIQHRLSLTQNSVDEMVKHSASLTLRQDNDLSILQELTEKHSFQTVRHAKSLSNLQSLKNRHQNQLQSMIEHVEESQLSFDRSVKNEEEKNETLFSAKQSEFEALLNQLTNEFNQVSEETWRSESLLQRKIHLKHTEIAAKIEDYDREMQYSVDKYANLQSISERENVEIQQLQAYFARKSELDEKFKQEREALRKKRDQQVMKARNTAEFTYLIEDCFDNWMKKTGKEPKKPAIKKDAKKKIKLMWRPPKVPITNPTSPTNLSTM